MLGQEATILVYTRPDGVVETEAIIIPDDGQEDRSHREIDDPSGITMVAGTDPGRSRSSA